MTLRRRAVGWLAVPLLLAGCAEGAAEAGPTAPATTATSSAPTAPGDPPEKAAMICDDELAGELRQILRLPSAPQGRSTWADQVFTCTYDLPPGPLVLSVTVSPSDADAQAFFDRTSASRPAATKIVGLGERAVGDPAGAVVVVKDDMTLVVDATGLPPVIGDNGQKRYDLAFTVAAAVMGCWVEG